MYYHSNLCHKTECDRKCTFRIFQSIRFILI